MAAKRTTTKKPTASEPKPCEPCKGTGEVASSVRVGRTRRTVGQQSGICLTCFGAGTVQD